MTWTKIEQVSPLRALADDGHLLWGDRYQRYVENRSESFLQCVLCGKPTSYKGASLGVWVSEGGAAIVHPDDYATYPHGGGDMGWFPVGASCIKAIPSEYRVENPYDNPVKGV